MLKRVDWAGFCPVCGARSSECDGRHPKEGENVLPYRPATDSRVGDFDFLSLDPADLDLPDRPEKVRLITRFKNVLAGIAEFFSNYSNYNELSFLIFFCFVSLFSFSALFFIWGMTIEKSILLGIVLGGFVDLVLLLLYLWDFTMKNNQK